MTGPGQVEPYRPVTELVTALLKSRDEPKAGFFGRLKKRLPRNSVDIVGEVLGLVPGMSIATAAYKIGIHRPVAEQARVLSLKMRGHYSYYGITGNARMLGRFAFEVRAIWRKWLGRRNNRGMSWERFYQLLEHHALPAPRIVHRYVASP